MSKPSKGIICVHSIDVRCPYCSLVMPHPFVGSGEFNKHETRITPNYVQHLLLA